MIAGSTAHLLDTKSTETKMMFIAEKISKLEHDINALKKLAKNSISSVESIADDGDRVWFSYIDSFEFLNNSNEVQDINFNVSNDADFVARRLTLSLSMNRADPVNNPGGISDDREGFFRPASFSYDERRLSDASKVDCQIDLTHIHNQNGKNVIKKFNNQPIPAYLTYSHNNLMGSPSALHLDIDWLIKRGTTVQCKVSVISSISGDSAAIDTYKIKGVLEGYKKVRAFR